MSQPTRNVVGCDRSVMKQLYVEVNGKVCVRCVHTFVWD